MGVPQVSTSGEGLKGNLYLLIRSELVRLILVQLFITLNQHTTDSGFFVKCLVIFKPKGQTLWNPVTGLGTQHFLIRYLPQADPTDFYYEMSMAKNPTIRKSSQRFCPAPKKLLVPDFSYGLL